MDKKTIGLIGVIVIFGLGVIACCILGAIAFSNTRNPEKTVKGIISNPKALKELSVALEKQKTISEKKERKKADTAQKKAITPMRVIPPKPSNTSTAPKNNKGKKNNKNSVGSKNKNYKMGKPYTEIQKPKKKPCGWEEAFKEMQKQITGIKNQIDTLKTQIK